MEKTFCVYIHTNTVNGKRYVGQTCRKNPASRWHKDGSGYKSNDHFTNAIKKYGWDSFRHQIVLDGLTLEEANLAESLLIDIFDTMNQEHGYNKKYGGNNGFLSDEAKRRISISNTGRQITDEHRAKISASKMGHQTPEALRKILSEKCSGWHQSEDVKRTISEKNTGKHWYNNGIRNVFAFEKPNGYVEGMIGMPESSSRKKSEYFSKTRWFTDGTRNVRSIECPDGFHAGRTRREDIA